MHWFEERVWMPARRMKKEPAQAEAWVKVQAMIPEAMNRLGVRALPPEVIAPGEAWVDLLLEGAKANYGAPYDKPEEVEEDVEHMRQALRELRGDMTFGNFFGTYPEGKAIYRPNPDLIDALAGMEAPDEYPTEALRLPRRCMVIDLSETLRHKDGSLRGNLAVTATYDMATGREKEGGLMIRFMEVYDLPGMGLCPLPLADLDLEPGKSLRQSLREVGERMRPRIAALADELVMASGRSELVPRIGDIRDGIADHSKVVEESRMSRKEYDKYAEKELPDHTWTEEDERRRRLMDHFSIAVNTLLYIQGEDDIVKQIHPGARPTKTSKNPEKAQRFKELAEPELFDVGQRYSATIERWEVESEISNSEGHGRGRPVRPHMRSAHPHLYWVGPGRKDARVRFLLPIAVKGGTTKEVPASVASMR